MNGSSGAVGAMGKYFDILAYLMGKQAGGGGGGGDITVESKSISANGTYTAPAGKAYSPVTVSVPNSYAAGDEGKVVSNGALVAQGSDSVTQNGTVDTTLINSLLVNVSGSSGYGYTKLAEQDFTVNTSSTSETSVGTISCGSEAYTSDKMLYVRVRDKAGRRNGYLYGGDYIVANPNPADGNNTSFSTCAAVLISVNGSGHSIVGQSSKMGVYAKTIATNGDISICAKYNGSYGAINGTYHVEVYLLDWPDGVSPFTT